MNRRGFLTGMAALAAPVIITTPGLLMPVKKLVVGEPVTWVREIHGIYVSKTFYVTYENGAFQNLQEARLVT